MMTRRTFVRRALVTTAVAATGAVYLNHEIDTHDIEVSLVRLSIGLIKPLKMVVLGDIHFDPLCDEVYMERVAKRVADLKADLVVYTGDFMTHRVARINDLAVLLSNATSRLGSFAALGNHDHWVGGFGIVQALDKNGIRVLRNECFALPDQEECYLTGLDSFWAGFPDMGIISRTPVNSRHIVVVHEPDSFSLLRDSRIKLQVSGHTHGGQVRLPMIGALVLPKWGKNYQEGLFAQSDSYLYVNRGVGTLFPHIRCNCRPEITMFELT